MTTPETPGPVHPWRAERTWREGSVWMASTHTWPTETDARTAVIRLAQGRDLPSGSTDVEVVLRSWEPKLRGWRTVDTGTRPDPALAVPAARARLKAVQ